MQKKNLLLIMLLIVSSLLSACGSYKFQPELNIEVENFTHMNQNNEEVTLETLKGEPWLAMFIFTNCNTVCPPMTFNMTEIQQALADKKVEDYNIVAFSVDPEVDTPEILTDYINSYSVADISKWQLLTGYKQAYIEQFARKSFQSHVKNDPTTNQVIHMSRYYLVNADGIVVKDYDAVEDVPVETIVEDIRALTK